MQKWLEMILVNIDSLEYERNEAFLLFQFLGFDWWRLFRLVSTNSE